MKKIEDFHNEKLNANLESLKIGEQNLKKLF